MLQQNVCIEQVQKLFTFFVDTMSREFSSIEPNAHQDYQERKLSEYGRMNMKEVLIKNNEEIQQNTQDVICEKNK